MTLRDLFMDLWYEVLGNHFTFGQELILFNHGSHARGFAVFQDAALDATIAAHSQWRGQSDLSRECHFDFHRGAIGDRLWQAEIHAA